MGWTARERAGDTIRGAAQIRRVRTDRGRGLTKQVVREIDAYPISNLRKRPFLARSLGLSAYWLPVPGQQVIEPAHRVAVRHAMQHVLEIGEGLDVVELCGGYEGANGRPSAAAAVRSREQMVFAPECDGPNGALDRIVVEFDASVVEESGEGWPARERITNGFRERTRRWNATELHLKPGLHHLDERPSAGVTNMPARVCGAALD